MGSSKVLTTSISVTPKKSQSFLRGRLSWRVTLSVFVTILMVEATILYFTAQNFENDKLADLLQTGRAAAVSLVRDNGSAGWDGVIDGYLTQRVFETTQVRGLAVYDKNLNVGDVYGEPPVLSPIYASTNAGRYVTWRNSMGDRYEMIFRPKDTGTDYTVVLRMDASEIKDAVTRYMTQEVVILLLLSGFVTSVLMLVLGRWLLEPILALRDNLLAAARDPNSPEKYFTRYPKKDELGSVISTANRLLKQNSENLTRLSKQAEDRIYRLAYYDSLTQLPNRTHFLQKLDELITDDKHVGQKIVMVADLDRFGDINDTMGYEVGDKVLGIVARKFQNALPETTFVARLGEDEFGMIIDVTSDADGTVQKSALRILSSLQSTISIDGTEFFLAASIGATTAPDNMARAIDILKKAESALDQAKQEDRGGYRLYTPEFDKAVKDRIQMAHDLRTAVDENQFELNYQPQFDARTGELIGVEALIRWNRPDPETGEVKTVSPFFFIPVAEQSGLIVSIGEWVLREACRFAVECTREKSLPDFRMAVNISGVQFQKCDLVALVKEVLQNSGLPPERLELEVTESVVMNDVEEAVVLLKQLKDIGVELAIDDFGTGYSSLSYLKRFPIHRLKVDRSFVMDATKDPDDAAITKTIVSLGHSLGLKVIAEGVETQEHVDFLNSIECDEFQGYFFSKPLSGTELVGYYKGYQSTRKRA